MPPDKLVRVAAHHAPRIDDADALQHGLGPVQALGRGDAGDLEDLGHLLADADGGVQRAAGVLIDHGDAARAEPPERRRIHGERVLAGDVDAARAHAPVRRQVASDGQRHRGLAAAGFADKAEGLAAADSEGEATDDLAVPPAHAIGNVEVPHVERRGGCVLQGG